MRWVLFAASAAVAAALWLPGEAAQPTPSAGPERITFAQYRDWRNRFNERRRAELAAQLAAGGLAPERKARLERVKEYYERLIGLPAAERDRRYRERFDRIDSDHDGTMDRAERAAWREKRRARSRRGRAAAPGTEAAQ